MVNVIKNRHTSHFVLFPCLENLRENLAVAQRLRDAPRRLKIAGGPGVCAHVKCAPKKRRPPRSTPRAPCLINAHAAAAFLLCCCRRQLAAALLCCCRRQLDPREWSPLSWFDPRAGHARKWVCVGACAALVSLVRSLLNARLNVTIYNHRFCVSRPLRTLQRRFGQAARCTV